ncbi:MAG: hypothetical protein EGS44_06365 [Akkermansia muciniphila]|nr:hypothetical protein [Akkermansia muciniphila]
MLEINFSGVFSGSSTWRRNEPVGITGYFFFRFPGGLAVADVVVGIDKASSPADPVFDQPAAAVVGEVSGGCRCGSIPGVPPLDRTHQRVVAVFVAGCQFAIRSLSVTDGGYEVEPGMIGIAADHAVGVGEMVEEAAGLVILPGKWRLQSFQIHPDDGTFGIVVKMGVLHGTGSKNQAISVGTTQGIVLFLGAVFHGSKGSVLDHVAVGIVEAFPDAGSVPDGGHLSEVVVGKLPSGSVVVVGDGDHGDDLSGGCREAQGAPIALDHVQIGGRAAGAGRLVGIQLLNLVVQLARTSGDGGFGTAV